MKVRGSQSHNPNGIHVDVDTVYVRSDAKQIADEDFTGWEYTEKRYSKDEFIRLTHEQNSLLNSRLDASSQTADLQEEILTELIFMAYS